MKNPDKMGNRIESSPSESRSDPFLLRVKNTSRKSGFTVVDLRFLKDWLGPASDTFLEAIRRNGRRYIAAQTTYSSRRVLQVWAEISAKRGWSMPNIEISEEELRQQLSRLREAFFSREVQAGNALTTAGNHWSQLTRLLDDLAATKALPPVARTNSRFASPNAKLLLADRAVAAQSPAFHATAPRNLNVAGDSFNDDLIEPISILASDDEYLEEYQHRLEHAIETIRACARNDFERLERQYQEGKKLISQFDRGLLRKFKCKERFRFLDPFTGKHFLKVEDEHPDLLKTLLGVVTYDMGGLPQPRFQFSAKREKSKTEGAWPYWHHIQRYGKNKLLPYLGIMSSEAAGICMLVLMLEHPKFNATSMYRARITREKNGQSYITSSGLTKEGSLRFTVEKPRSAEEKSEELSELARRVLGRVIEWTRPAREALRRAGRNEEAAMLWVGMSSLTYNIIHFSEKTLFGSVVGNTKWRSYGKTANSARAVAFLDRHSELKPWAEKVTFKSIRVNLGVLRYLQSGGDLVATARAFGHKNVATTIRHYIPEALRIAIYERQIRRHQNRLLANAVDSEQDRLQVMDFKTTEKLHQFLASLRQDASSPSAPQPTHVIRKEGVSSRLVICDDPTALAIAMIYRDKLKAATAEYLDLPDRLTGVKPRFWCEFVDAVIEPLPLALTPVAALVRRAVMQRAHLEPLVRLPEIW